MVPGYSQYKQWMVRSYETSCLHQALASENVNKCPWHAVSTGLVRIQLERANL